MRAVAQKVGAVPSSVVRWEQAFDRDGDQGLNSKPQAGGKARLSTAQKKRLVDFLLKGPTSFGWRTELWTLSRVAEVIERKFGVRYHVSHVHRMLHALGFSAQKPERLARERDDAAIEMFRKKTWPAIKKKRGARAAR
jgi:transposase